MRRSEVAISAIYAELAIRNMTIAKEVGIMKCAVRIIVITAVFILCMAHISGAADFPERPVTLVNPQSPGGTNDILGRIWCAVAQKYLGQPVVITNKTGGGGWQGLVDVREARADGYTLLADATGRITQEQWLAVNKKPVPATLKDFTLIGIMNMSPTLFIVNYDSPWKTLDDLIEACKAKPNQYAFSASAYGTTHFPILLLMDLAGIEARPVFFVGGGPAHNALLGGHVHFSAQFPGSVIPFVQGKKERALAVTAEKRWPSLPDVPTCKERGYNVLWGQGIGIFAPKGTPSAIVKKLRDVHQKVVKDNKFIEMIENVGDFVYSMTPDEFNEYYENTSKTVNKLFAKEAAKPKK